MKLDISYIRDNVEMVLEEKLDEMTEEQVQKIVNRVAANTEKPWWNEECVNDDYLTWLITSAIGNYSITRGYRNNNPGNIRLTRSKWEGLCSQQKDELFCQFTHMKYGFRAMLKLLNNYYYTYRCLTARDIIARWAPAADNNDTSAYIKQVCTAVGTTPARKLSGPITDREFWSNFVVAMAKIENGSNRYGYEHTELMDCAREAWDILYKK